MKLIKAKTQSDFFACMLIRTKVFISELHIDPKYEIDEDDKNCDHYLLIYDDKEVGTVRIIQHDKVWHLGRIAILKEYRKNHFGSFLLKQIEELAYKEQIQKLELGAHKDAVNFYIKNGYDIAGESFLDADVLHYPLEKKL